jgi:carbon monoxide dehydrogenase subunit G
MKIESKIGVINAPSEKVFNFVTDFNNFKNLVPADQVKNWESDAGQCAFDVEGLGRTGMRILEQEPFKLLKIKSIDTSPFGFFLWIQLKQMAENDTRVKVTIEPQVNQMMQMMVKTPLKKFVDALVDKMSAFHFNEVAS